MNQTEHDLLVEVAENWDEIALKAYIMKLEMRVNDTQSLIKQLRKVLRRKTRRNVVDTGARDGR